MKLEIRKIDNGEYSWFLFSKGQQVARMPDGTAAPSKIKRTVKAFQAHTGIGSAVWRACEAALREFETIHPTSPRRVVS